MATSANPTPDRRNASKNFKSLWMSTMTKQVDDSRRSRKNERSVETDSRDGGERNGMERQLHPSRPTLSYVNGNTLETPSPVGSCPTSSDLKHASCSSEIVAPTNCFKFDEYAGSGTQYDAAAFGKFFETKY